MIAAQLLCDRQDLRPQVASWLLSEWPTWYGPGGKGNLELDIHSYGASAATLPVGIVVLDGETPVGFGALKHDTIASHSHLSPWAGAGYVVPELRGRGIGGALLRAIVSHAHSLGIRTVYCATSTADSLLRRSGWHFKEQVAHENGALSIYQSGV